MRILLRRLLVPVLSPSGAMTAVIVGVGVEVHLTRYLTWHHKSRVAARRAARSNGGKGAAVSSSGGTGDVDRGDWRIRLVVLLAGVVAPVGDVVVAAAAGVAAGGCLESRKALGEIRFVVDIAVTACAAGGCSWVRHLAGYDSTYPPLQSRPCRGVS